MTLHYITLNVCYNWFLFKQETKDVFSYKPQYKYVNPYSTYTFNSYYRCCITWPYTLIWRSSETGYCRHIRPRTFVFLNKTWLLFFLLHAKLLHIKVLYCSSIAYILERILFNVVVHLSSPRSCIILRHPCCISNR